MMTPVRHIATVPQNDQTVIPIQSHNGKQTADMQVSVLAV